MKTHSITISSPRSSAMRGNKPLNLPLFTLALFLLSLLQPGMQGSGSLAQTITSLLAHEAFAGTNHLHPRQGGLLHEIVDKGEIRAAYIPWAPMTIVDPGTGEVSGIYPEILEKIAKKARLKIIWTEQVDWGTAIEGLKTGRYDILGTAAWPSTDRALHASFTRPICYSAVEVFARQDEKRFKSLEDINQPEVIIATVEGEMGDIIARTDFPKASRNSMPSHTDVAQIYLELIYNKADVIFNNLITSEAFMRKNPGKVKRLFPEKPLRIFGNAYMVPLGEFEFADFLGMAIEELHNTGEIEKILKKYNVYHLHYPVALPYKSRENAPGVQ